MDSGLLMLTAILAASSNDNQCYNISYMKKNLIKYSLVFSIAFLFPQLIQAQGTVYLSNLAQASTGGVTVGSNSWFAAEFRTGTNTGGYLLNSVQLGMTDASGSPNGFTVLIYSAISIATTLPGSSLGTLNGSLSPATAGVFTYTPVANLTLSRQTDYFIVLTAATAIANGAYGLSLSGIDSYNPSGNWRVIQGLFSGVYGSSNGSAWNSLAGTYPQFAIDATAIPEPGVLSLFALGSLGLLWRLKAKIA